MFVSHVFRRRRGRRSARPRRKLVVVRLERYGWRLVVVNQRSDAWLHGRLCGGFATTDDSFTLRLVVAVCKLSVILICFDDESARTAYIYMTFHRLVA